MQEFFLRRNKSRISAVTERNTCLRNVQFYVNSGIEILQERISGRSPMVRDDPLNFFLWISEKNSKIACGAWQSFKFFSVGKNTENRHASQANDFCLADLERIQ